MTRDEFRYHFGQFSSIPARNNYCRPGCGAPVAANARDVMVGARAVIDKAFVEPVPLYRAGERVRTAG